MATIVTHNKDSKYLGLRDFCKNRDNLEHLEHLASRENLPKVQNNSNSITVTSKKSTLEKAED